MSDNTPDALSQFMDPEADPAKAPQSDTGNAEILARFEAMEKKMQAMEEENANLKTRLRAGGVIKGPDPVEVGIPYRGPVEVMIHPHTGHEVEIKPEHVEAALAQGFKKIPASKRK